MSTTNKLKAVLSYRFAVLGLLAMLVLLGCQDITDVDGANAPELSALQQSAKAVNAITPINNVADLMAVDSEPDGNFVLAADLTLINWVAICDPNALSGPFVGTFDGAGHTLTVESFDTTGEFIGVFAGIGDGSASPAVSNLTVNVAAPAFTTATACNVGGLAAVVNKADIQDVTVTGTLDVTYNGDAPPEGWQALKDGATLRFRSLGGTPIGLDGLAVGGIAGTLAPATVLRAQTSVSIDAAATTFNVPVYAGGVVGYADKATITASKSSSNITSNGYGYNTSGGGIAGYIVGTTVTVSSASGTINASALGKNFDYYDSWQVYAGGLVGYSGSSGDTKGTDSLIELSHATGPATAYAPFPYAGGLLGYNYGYMDPVTYVSSNGSTVRRSYATGNATATSQLDPNKVYGDIPYAGGLVGYSSVIGSLIQDSYARGNVQAVTTGTYAWVGGLIGGNANDSIVARTYATGDVHSTVGTLPPLYAPLQTNAGPAAGGIAGYNYYTIDTEVRNSVALNSLVYGNQTTQDVVHRVVGDVGTAPQGTLHRNLAYAGMSVGANWTLDEGADLPDGDNTVAQPGQSVYEALNWTFGTIWHMGADGYPAL